jgi:HK97 family phage portal protein
MRFYFGIDRDKRTEQREDYPQQSISTFIKWLTTGLWGKKTSAGENVDEETALTFSAVYACVRILSETLASLPFHVYRQEDNGNKYIDASHPLYRLIHDAPSKNFTSFTFRETMMAFLSLWGNAYARIIRSGAYLPIELEIIHPANVDVSASKNGNVYTIKAQEGKTTKVNAVDMIHVPALSFDGLKGKSPIEVAAENIGLGLALQRFGAEFFRNGAALSGMIEHPGKLSDTAYKHIMESLENKHVGKDNRHRLQVLEEGMKYAQVTVPPEAAQFIASRKFQLNEVARIFRIPPHMLADLERSTNNNIEHQGIEFVQYTMLPWCVRFEQEFNRKIFKGNENGKYFVKFNLNGLLRGDAASRAQHYKDMFYEGIYSINEIRELEDMNKIGPEGDVRYIVSNLVPVGQVANKTE